MFKKCLLFAKPSFRLSIKTVVSRQTVNRDIIKCVTYDKLQYYLNAWLDI